MPTSVSRRSLVAVIAAALAFALAFGVDAAPGAGAAPTAMVDATSHTGRACSASPGHGWPVKPFHRPHAIRGAFGDPRIGLDVTGSHITSTFHTGVDVVAADGTPVYATMTGSVLLDPVNPFVVWIRDGHGTTFSYWHVVPAVHTGERVIAYETIVGHVQRPWAHVHFAELRDGEFVNPLRPGAMGPYVDRTAPQVASITLERHARSVPLDRASGSLDVIAQVDDPPAHAIAPPWDGLAVMPARVRWRLVGAYGAGTRWATAVDYSQTIPAGGNYGRTYAQWTRQNHPGREGRYRVYLARALQARMFPAGRYRVEVAVSDVCGNGSTASAWIDIDNGSLL
jgi:Peptidase family M23